jgi:glycosyltransferase involved in cell wall biosynthesis
MEQKAMQKSFSKNLKKPLVSIITVVYNSEQFLEKTILSVINQSYTNYEYIIIDGGSTDKTIEIIEKYNTSISKWISEKDNGLYDAMNKGMHLASGDYIWFVNSGDQIHLTSTLEQIFSKIELLPDLIYGETEIIDSNEKYLGMRRHSAPENLNWKMLSKGMLVCHQSVLVKKEISEDYNLKYKHSSDFEWLIRVLKKSGFIYNSGLVLSKFLEGGQTSKTLKSGLKERFRIMKIYYGLVPTLYKHFIMIFRLASYYLKHRRL